MYTVKIDRSTPDGRDTQLAETNGDYRVSYRDDGVHLILQPDSREVLLLDGDVAQTLSRFDRDPQRIGDVEPMRPRLHDASRRHVHHPNT